MPISINQIGKKLQELSDQVGSDAAEGVEKFANELEIVDNKVTGRIKGDIIDAERKGEILVEITRLENITKDQIVAVGDGANDRFMLENAGLAIAFSPKEILKEYSDGMITTDNLSGLRYFLGIPEE